MTIAFFQAFSTRDGAREWLVADDGERMYTYVRNLDDWRRNDAVEVDAANFPDNELELEPIDVTAVASLLSVTPGIDEAHSGTALDLFRAQAGEDVRSHAELGITLPEQFRTLSRARAYEHALRSIDRPDHKRAIAWEVAKAEIDVDEGRADALVLVARRMACTYALLHASDETPLSGRACSDRFLQLADPVGWQGRRVILLDDTRATGSTLSERAKNIERLVGEPGRVDPRPAITIPEENSEEHYELHNQFARAFSDGLQPFFTDFPVTKAIDVDAIVFEDLLAHDAWRTVDVTNAIVSGSPARAYSLFPLNGIAHALLDELGDLARLVEVVKVRVFARNNGDRTEVRFVPLILTSPMEANSVQEWIARVGLRPNGSADQSAQALSLISFMLSRRLLDVLGEFMRRTFGLRLEEDGWLTRLMLGDLDTRTTDHYLRQFGVLEKYGKASSGPLPPVFIWPEGLNDSGEYHVLAGDDLVKGAFECLSAAQLDVRAPRRPGWEKNATTMAQIAEHDESNLMTASLAIDVLNDLGYAIPASLTHGGYVFRGYRAGEVALEPLDKRPASPHGGRLAAFPRTREVSHEEYFGDARADDGARSKTAHDPGGGDA